MFMIFYSPILSETLSSLSTFPLPIMESPIFEAQSAPGLATSDIWKPNVSSPKSEGSALSISSNPCSTLDAVAAALENFDLARKLKSESAPEGVIKDQSDNDELSKDTSSQETALLRQGSPKESLHHRPRSISDIVEESRKGEAGCSGVERSDSPTGAEAGVSVFSFVCCFIDNKSPISSFSF